jgi:hypothetical protein
VGLAAGGEARRERGRITRERPGLGKKVDSGGSSYDGSAADVWDRASASRAQRARAGDADSRAVHQR